MADNAKLTRAADNIRVLAASMVEKAKSGHPGGAMGGADFINVLYTEFLRYDPDDLRYPFRDRLFLDPGHMSPMLYSTLALAGNYTMDDLKAFRQWGSCTPGHPEVDVLRGVENTSGPLGQGHAMALGADCYITGEIRHHEALDAVDKGCCVIEAGHFETENPVCEVLAAALQNAADALQYNLTVFCLKGNPFGR